MRRLIIIFSFLLSTHIVLPTCFDFAHAARPKYLFKIASLAPDGSVWAKRFNSFVKEIEEKSNGEIGFKVYPGGVMGDDRSMYRKMRVGQIQGGGFTVTGISEVVPDFRVLGIPFLFNSYEEVDHSIKGLLPEFKKAFEKQNLVLLSMTEVGFLYGMSTAPMIKVEDLRNSKVWIPEGDPISNNYLREIGVNPTQLAIPDVLTSLQTGLVDTVFNSFYGTIVLQWYTRAKYITDIPFAYSYGALVIDKRSYSRLPKEYADLMEMTVKKHFSLLLDDTRKSNTESLDVLKKNGVNLVIATPEAKADLRKFRDQTITKLVGTAFSKKIYDETQQLLTEYRSKNTSGKTTIYSMKESVPAQP